MYRGALRNDEVFDPVPRGVVEGEGGCCECRAVFEELSKIVARCWGAGYVANVGRDLFDDAFEDGEVIEAN